MTNEMIERVAKVLSATIYTQRSIYIDCNKLACAAIQAMYEPTDQQRNFYYDLKRKSGSTPMYSTFEDATWEMMILACLEQNKIDEIK